jgi:4-aminobutyrate aminotransferase
MIGVEFSTAEIASVVEEACFQKGLLVLGCGDKALRMSPPLMIDRGQVETGLRLFSEVVAEVAH